MNIKCFMLDMLEPPMLRLSLRRYHSKSDGEDRCLLKWGYHDTSTFFADVVARVKTHVSQSGFVSKFITHDEQKPPQDDPRWPKYCACGYAFTLEDTWQLSSNTLYRRRDTGQLLLLRDAPVGAIWNAWWESNKQCGYDGKSMNVMTPGGAWGIDGRASNCDSPCQVCGVGFKDHREINQYSGQHSYVDSRQHKCWVRHGDDDMMHVDKNGVTCNAGGGSIICGDYHGFLHHGHLTNA